MVGIPDEIKALAELSPVEDLILAILREGLPGIEVQSLIEDDEIFPLVTVRRDPSFGGNPSDPRFTDAASVVVMTFVSDPDGDEDSAILSEVVRVLLRNAWLDQRVIPGRGHIIRIDMTSPPRRVADWATSSGPVQYADLPTGIWRYQATYSVEIRKPVIHPYPVTP
jgi:hypothetical protein